MVEVDACISSNLKEELAWATDKQFWVISNMYNKNGYSTKELHMLKGTEPF